MKIQYCSDLHLEFRENAEYLKANPLIPSADILVLAGDIVPFGSMQKHDEFFDQISKQYEFVYWIPGNHEYYHGDINARSGSFSENIRENVILLNNRVVELERSRLLFSTLWSKISPQKAWTIQHGMADFQVITDSKAEFTIERFNVLYHESVAFLKTEMAKTSNLPAWVVTHHVPTFQDYPAKYKDSPLNEAFASELSDLIIEASPDCWLYGHHHQPVPQFRVGSTRLVTNQLGYVRYGEHTTFNERAIIDL